MSDFVLDASLALQWFFEDETDRKYTLGVLASLSEKRALVPLLWFYEVGNGLLMAFRRNRITVDQIQAFLTRFKNLPIDAAQQTPAEILELPHSRVFMASRITVRLISRSLGDRRFP